jgi:hypothetical protein
MRRFTILFFLLVLLTAAHAQTVSTFDDLTLSKPDTAYINYSASGTDVGFDDGLAHFPCVYDTDYGGSWASGFAYTNWTDSVTSGYTNEYSAKTAIGYNGSHNYVTAFVSNPITYAYNVNINLTGAAIGKTVFGFEITNSTYAYNSMKYGDMFDTAFHHGDWFLLTIKGYRDSMLTPDSVNFYLADYRFADTDSNYILNTWQWVNLTSLGHVDSLQFSLSASDTGAYGMNVPAFFCMDNFTTNETNESIKTVATAVAAKVYPNPATNTLNIDIADNTASQIMITDMAGNLVATCQITGNHTAINTASLATGTYLLQLSGNGKSGSVRFVKE